MNPNHLFEHSKGYNWLRAYTRFMHSLYYKEVCIKNAENIPENDLVIFAPNHQQALMDALAILLYLEKQPVFMARADIFKKDTVKKILTFLKIIPVFRIRDGVESLANNDETFDIALKTLKSGQPVGVMPEGNHGHQRNLRQMKKGLMRLAFKAQEDVGAAKNVVIVPVGLEFSSYQNFRSRLLVNFGKPIPVAEYMNMYAENSAKGLTALRDRLADDLSQLILNIDTEHYYDTIFDCKDIYTSHIAVKENVADDFYKQIVIEKKVTDNLLQVAKHLPEQLDSLKVAVDKYTNGLKNLKIRNHVMASPIQTTSELVFDILRYLLFLPVFCFSALMNAVPYFLTIFLSRNVKDPQFVRSFRFVLGLLIFPVYYLMLFALPLPFFTKTLIIVLIPILGVLSFDYFIALKKLGGRIRYFQLQRKGSVQLAQLKNLRESIIQKIESYL